MSLLCNHANQIKHGNQTMEPSAILKKKEENDIFKPNYLLTAQVCMNYAYSALITNTFLNVKNEITQNVSNFCIHGNQTMEPSAILQEMTFSNQIIS